MTTLVSTLELGLRQCQEQLKIIHDQAERIERLHQENTRLRWQIANSRNGRACADGEIPSVEVAELLQENVELKAEIGFLKKKLKQGKDKASDIRPRPSRPSSTASSGSGSVPVTLHSGTRLLDCTSIKHESILSSVPRKRLRTASPVMPALRATLSNDGKSAVSPNAPISKGEVAVLPSDIERQTVSTDRALESTETMQRGDTTSSVDLCSTQSPSVIIQSEKCLPESRKPKKREDTSATASGSVDSVTPKQSYRSLPPEKLSLSHFKRNPEFVDSWDCTVDEIVRGRQRHRCSAACISSECAGARLDLLISTLPSLPSLGQNGEGLTDDDLLRSFLGPESEDRIAKLTPVARQNLIQEARTKLVSSIYKRRRADADRLPTPPGFWSIDMPSSQEEHDNNDKGKRQVDEEVKRRYHEALRGNSRWVFADECKSTF